MSFKSCVSGNSLPLIVWSHIISLISPMSSVVFASSKNNTVCVPGNSSRFRFAWWIAKFTLFSMSFAVVPPWTWKVDRQMILQRYDYRLAATAHCAWKKRMPAKCWLNFAKTKAIICFIKMNLIQWLINSDWSLVWIENTMHGYHGKRGIVVSSIHTVDAS